MADALPSIVVTGISGNLGRRLLPMLSGFRVVGVDFRPPQTDLPLQFEQMDLGVEASCLEFIQLLRDVRPVAVLHLAFIMDAVRTGILDRDRIWQTNVAGTARVMEAVTEANRDWPMVEKFVFLSSVSAARCGAPWVQRLHFASAYFCRAEYRQLLHGSISRHSWREQQAGRAYARAGQTASMHVAFG